MHAKKIPRSERNDRRYRKQAGQLPHSKSGQVVNLDREKFDGALAALTR